MNILSVSHKLAPIEVRAKFSLTEEKQKEFLQRVVENEHIFECVYLSTCNRTEIYFNGDEMSVQELEKNIIDFTETSNEDLKKYFRFYQGDSAINHLYRVASGLDSMLIGEDEILGQLKDAFNFALNLGMTKYHLNTLFKGAITCAKNIKTNTNMSKIPVSIATLVTNLILNFDKKNVNVLIIGLTGQMGTTILKNLYTKENIHITGTTRQHNSILQYKSDYGRVDVINYTDRFDYIDRADIIISVTKCPHYTLTAQEVQKNISENKKRIFIDLSVPKDIDDEIANIENTSLFNVDYFKNIANINNLTKVKEVEMANVIIDEHIDQVKKDLDFHDFIKHMENVKTICKNNTFENIIYKIRDNSNSEELSVILNALKKLEK